GRSAGSPRQAHRARLTAPGLTPTSAGASIISLWTQERHLRLQNTLRYTSDCYKSISDYRTHCNTHQTATCLISDCRPHNTIYSARRLSLPTHYEIETRNGTTGQLGLPKMS